MRSPVGAVRRIFLSTPSARRATTLRMVSVKQFIISIHALREEGDLCRTYVFVAPPHFYPRPPRGGRPSALPGCSCISPNFYPRPPRGGRRQSSVYVFCSFLFLSTPSARRATSLALCIPRFLPNFYPRPPRGGRRPDAPRKSQDCRFLSTPSARRATAKTEKKYSAFVLV